MSDNMTTDGLCPECSHALEQHDRDFRFLLPDEFSDFTPDELEARLSGDDKFLRVDENRYFTRSILQVQLSGGHEINYGIWMESDLATLRRLYEVWDDPAYASTTVEGTVANDLPPWPGVAIGATVWARPRRIDELPYLIESSDDAVAGILSKAWDHDLVLTTFLH